MLINIHHRRLNGRPVMLVVTIDADGAVQYWRSEDPITGAHVELDEADKWCAVAEMGRAIKRMARGAA